MLGIIKKTLLENAKKLLGVEDIDIYKDFIIGKLGTKYYAHGFLVLKEVLKSSEDLTPSDIINLSKLYLRLLNIGIPIAYKVYIQPVNREKLLKDIDRSLQEKLVILEHDPSNAKLKTEITKLEKLKKKLLEGFQPYEIKVIFSITTSAETIDEAISELKVKIKSLKSILQSSGIYVEELKGRQALIALISFFRPTDGNFT